MKPGDLAQCKFFILSANLCDCVEGPHRSIGQVAQGDVMIIINDAVHSVSRSTYYFVLTRLGFGFIYEGFIERVIPDACVESLRSA